MASEKLQAAYDAAVKSPMKVRLNLYTDGSPALDSQWRKDEKKRLKAELEQVTRKIKKFDRDKAADSVLSLLIKEQKKLEDRLDNDGDYEFGVTL